jgi:hypothetical protein
MVPGSPRGRSGHSAGGHTRQPRERRTRILAGGPRGFELHKIAWRRRRIPVLPRFRWSNPSPWAHSVRGIPSRVDRARDLSPCLAPVARATSLVDPLLPALHPGVGRREHLSAHSCSNRRGRDNARDVGLPPADQGDIGRGRPLVRISRRVAVSGQGCRGYPFRCWGVVLPGTGGLAQLADIPCRAQGRFSRRQHRPCDTRCLCRDLGRLGCAQRQAVAHRSRHGLGSTRICPNDVDIARRHPSFGPSSNAGSTRRGQRSDPSVDQYVLALASSVVTRILIPAHHAGLRAEPHRTDMTGASITSDPWLVAGWAHGVHGQTPSLLTPNGTPVSVRRGSPTVGSRRLLAAQS